MYSADADACNVAGVSSNVARVSCDVARVLCNVALFPAMLQETRATLHASAVREYTKPSAEENPQDGYNFVRLYQAAANGDHVQSQGRTQRGARGVLPPQWLQKKKFNMDSTDRNVDNLPIV